MSLRKLLISRLEIPSVRAIRGAISVPSDDPAAIDAATGELLDAVVEANDLASGEVISVIFTVTPDLVSAFPATAARAAGWIGVPLLCTTEIPVPDGLERCLRVMLHVERPWRSPPNHVYLRDAVALRPDLGRWAGGSRATR